jgi:hypothetical protein
MRDTLAIINKIAIFFRKRQIIKGKSYMCLDNKIGNFTIGKIYKCYQTNYLEDDFGSADVSGEYKDFWNCFKEM